MEKTQVELAAEFAKKWHAGQLYGEVDYFEGHVKKVAEAVAMHGGGEREVIVAYLHDVIEDTEADIHEIAEIFGMRIAEAVEAITKRAGQERFDYLDQVLCDNIAKQVKIQDAIFNLQQSYKEKNWRRIRKYQQTLSVLFMGLV